MIKFILMSPTRKQVMEIEWLELVTPDGSFIIKPGHAPIISILANNREITMGLPDGTTTLMTISGGIVSVERDLITLLLTHE